MELDRFTGRFPHTRHTPETSEIVTLPHQMATDYVWLKTQIGLIPSGIPALARIWLKTRLDSKSSESNLVRVRVPPLVLFEIRGFWQGAESPFKLRRISHTLHTPYSVKFYFWYSLTDRFQGGSSAFSCDVLIPCCHLIGTPANRQFHFRLAVTFG